MRMGLTGLAALVAVLAHPALADIPAVRHVVIVIQENRTPDNLFHGLPSVLPAADIADSGTNSTGQIIPLTSVALANNYDLSHMHSDFTAMYDGGKMDGADLIPCRKVAKGTTCLPNPGSAYTVPGYVSLQTHSFGSMLKFIETAFSLPLIPPGTFVDSRSDDLSDFFDFSKPPRTFAPVPAPIEPSFFLHDPRPLEGPDDE